MTATPLRVALVDDHAVVRAGYRRFLELEGIVVALEAGDADSAYAALGRADTLPVDLLVVDLSLPGRGGLDFMRQLRRRWPSARVLVFSMHDDPATVGQCLRAGAAGFVTKSSDPGVLVQAVLKVARGETALSPDVAGRLGHADTAPHAGLSTREFEVLRALLAGQGVDEIALQLHVSAKTVANYQTAIRQKLGVANAVELMHYARRHGLVA